MTNLSTATPEELIAYEAKLELINRIRIRERINHLLIHENADLSEVLKLMQLASDMADLKIKQQKQDHADVKALSRDRELALAESQVAMKREALAVTVMKLDAKQGAVPLSTTAAATEEKAKSQVTIPGSNSHAGTGPAEIIHLVNQGN